MKRHRITIDWKLFVPFLMRVLALVAALVGAFSTLPDKWRLFFALWGVFEMFAVEYVQMICKS